jgi:xylan 1,4-beta-xylosidase
LSGLAILPFLRTLFKDKYLFLRTIAAFLVSGLLLLPLPSWAQQRVIEVNVKASKGKLDRTFNAAVGAGRANKGLRADWQQQLAEIKRAAGFRYIRMHLAFTYGKASG